MSAQKSKQQRIKQWFKKGLILTPRTAIDFFACYRLAAVVFRLNREQGMKIENVGRHNHAIYKQKK